MKGCKPLILLTLVVSVLLGSAVQSIGQTPGDITQVNPASGTASPIPQIAADTGKTAPPIHVRTDAPPETGAERNADANMAAKDAVTCMWLLCTSEWIADHPICASIFGGLGILIVVVTASLLWSSRPTAKRPAYITQLSASFFFWLGLGYLTLLLLASAFYVQAWSKPCPLLLGGVLPIAVPWFGALGAVVISLEGVFAFGTREWDAKYNYWHIGRPLFGAVLGVVAFFTFVLIVSSSGSVPPFLDGGSPSNKAKDYIIYYVVAFLVGYREETFRELMRRVTDMILKPNTPSDAAPVITFRSGGASITQIDFGTVASGASKSIEIEVVNSGKSALLAPKATIDQGGSPGFAITKDQFASGDLKPGESRTIGLTFTPTGSGAAASTLVITGTNLTTSVKLPLSGAQ